MKEKLREKKWYPYTVALCIAVILYVALTHLGAILGAAQGFLGYFKAIFLGCVLAYLMNPLAMLFRRTLFLKVRGEKPRWTLSIALAVASLLLLLVLLLGTLIPQLADSIRTLMENMDEYLDALQSLTKKLGVIETLKLEELIGSSGDLMNKLADYLMNNINGILGASAEAGKSLVNWFVALVLSVYLLASKDALKRGTLRLLRALLPQKRMDAVSAFFGRCDRILVRYIVFTLLDALIVGAANAIFMACCGMQYIGLVSLTVAATNLLPTFGPIVGAAIGGFILLLVKPLHALLFPVFAMVLQFLDGYVIKPKLFSGSLGVSGLLILAAIIVFGNLFGIVGILFAIPIAAILDYSYEEWLLPALEKRAENRG